MNSLLAADSIRSYVHSSKQEYERAHGHTRVHFVMGNEAADLDSVVSSIAFAYLLQKENPNEFYIPLINLERKELDLRPDVLHLLNNHVAIDDLLFLNSVSFEDLYDHDLMRLNLVDHNILRPRQQKYFQVVERIVDHHADEKVEYPLLKMKNVTVIGSSASLVTEYFQKSLSAKMNPDIALMLLAPILMDTGNLKMKEKTTKRDIDAVDYLQTYVQTPATYYETLMDKKHNVSNFTPKMAFSKDYKEFLEGPVLYGIASIPQSIYWGNAEIPTLIPELEKFANERDLTFLILLMVNPEKSPKRVLLVYSKSEELSEAFKNYVHQHEVLQKEFLILNHPENPKVLLYGSDSGLTSRKQIQPLFHFSDSEEIMEILFQASAK